MADSHSTPRCSADMAGKNTIIPDHAQDPTIRALKDAIVHPGMAALAINAFSTDYRVERTQWLHAGSVSIFVRHAARPNPYRISIEEVLPPLVTPAAD